ncbi:MAG: LysE family translocator [Gammaproteobacteria bacterium]|nr:LysE family translocator [Gammaproteobacteria bacterium]
MLVDVFIFAFSMTITPGPANIALLAASTQHGVRASLGFLLGVLFGFYLLGSALSLGLYLAIEQQPILLDVLRILGTAYLLWLVYKIATTKHMAEGNSVAPSFWYGLLIHPLNPKAWMMISACFGQFTTPETASVSTFLSIIAVFGIGGAISNTTWFLAGSKLKAWLNTPQKVSLFNRVAAAALALVIIKLW